MNILIAGDLHFNKSQFRWLEEQQDNYDCLCLTGDFLDDYLDDFQRQVEWVTDWLKKLNTQIFICSGNQDLDDLAECDWLTNIKSSNICGDGQTKLFNGIKFGCMPYLGCDLSDFYDCDILLTHVPPSNTATARSKDKGSQREWGDAGLYNALKEMVVRPQYIFCGHVEEPEAKKDNLFGVEIINPGAQHNLSVPGHEIIRENKGVGKQRGHGKQRGQILNLEYPSFSH